MLPSCLTLCVVSQEAQRSCAQQLYPPAAAKPGCQGLKLPLDGGPQGTVNFTADLKYA